MTVIRPRILGCFFGVLLAAGVIFVVVKSQSNPSRDLENFSPTSQRELKRLSPTGNSGGAKNIFEILNLPTDSPSREVISGIYTKLKEIENPNDFSELVRAIPTRYWNGTPGEHLSNTVWRFYPETDPQKKFSLLLDMAVSMEPDPNSPSKISEALMRMLGNQFPKIGCPEIDFERLVKRARIETLDAFGDGFDNSVSLLDEGDPQEMARAVLNDFFSKEIDHTKLRSLAAPYINLYLEEHAANDAVAQATVIFDKTPELKRVAFRTILKRGGPTPDDVGNMINSVGLTDPQEMDQFVSSVTKSVIARGRNSPEEVLSFVGSLADLADQMRAAPHVGRSFALRGVKDLKEFRWQNISREAKAEIVRAFSEHKS
jgi:hypothetical protein